MTLVVGTAGHIDHGKTALLRALTGIDADRLPDERRRGMTIDVGYAHMRLDDGAELDFVDVPGHDRLVGNMLVGAGEIDAVMLVVAADDGPRAQTLEHLDLLDALGLSRGLAVVTKTDLVDERRVAEVSADARRLLGPTSLAAIPILAVSALSSAGLDELRMALAGLPHGAELTSGSPRLAVDRAFAVRGRGAVVTGTLRGGPVSAGDVLRIVPGGREVRVREVQVHGRQVERAEPGRAALNLAGIDATDLRRGLVLTLDPEVVESDRILVALRGRQRAPKPGARLRLHVGTEQAGAVAARAARDAELAGGELAALLRLDHPIAAAPGDRFVLRDPGTRATAAGGRVLDPEPPRGVARRRTTAARLDALARAVDAAARGQARLALHGILGGRIAPDLAADLAQLALRVVDEHHVAEPGSTGIPLAELRALVARSVRRSVTLSAARAERAAAAICDALVRDGRLERDADRLRAPGRPSGPSPELAAAMDRLEAALSVAAPVPFDHAVRDSGCPPEGVRALETTGRIVRLDAELAYAAGMLRELEERALNLATRGPLTPAAFRDATGTSRRYVLAILEDLDRRGVLRRTPDGHLPGPRALARGAR
jgi:selenocysteine-specific elongation factor